MGATATKLAMRAFSSALSSFWLVPLSAYPVARDLGVPSTAVEHHGFHHLPHGLAGLCLEHLPFADRGELLNGTAVRGQDLETT